MTLYDANVVYDDPAVLYGGDPAPPVVAPVTPTVLPQPNAPLTTKLQMRIPFGVDSSGGIATVAAVADVDRINLITLIGTQPGERAMRPEYGVALRDLLFENDDQVLIHNISSEIFDAAITYAPEITITEVSLEPDVGTEGRTNVRVGYRTAVVRLDTSEGEISTTVSDGGA